MSVSIIIMDNGKSMVLKEACFCLKGELCFPIQTPTTVFDNLCFFFLSGILTLHTAFIL